MDFMLISLLIYLVGTVTIIWPKRTELAAHYFGMICSVVASGLVAYSALMYLLFPSGSWLVDTYWGSYSLQAAAENKKHSEHNADQKREKRDDYGIAKSLDKVHVAVLFYEVRKYS